MVIEKLSDVPQAVLLRMLHILQEQRRWNCEFGGCSCCGTVVEWEYRDEVGCIKEIDCGRITMESVNAALDAQGYTLQNTRAHRPQEETNE